MSNSAHYHREQLRDLVEGRMSFPEEGAIVSHLDVCPTCQSTLHSLSGGDAWASETRDWLRSLDGIEHVSQSSQPWSEDEDGHDGAELPRVMLQCLAPTDDPAMLGRLGIYEVSGIVGAGGAGIVFKALERSLNRFVAVKVLSPILACNAAARKRFAREAKAAAAVVHEHIVPIYAVDEFQGLPFLVMQYVPGRSLQQRLNHQGPLGVREILRIGHQTALGLAAAHAQGVVHRDIKPANILLENGVERVLLTDFGLARTVDDASLTCSGVIAGTPEYMSPEQARGEAVDHRSDLFSLGSVLYSLCTGHSPFRASTTMGILQRICQDAPRPVCEVNSEIPDSIGDYIDRLLDKRIHRRPQSAQEVAQWCAEQLSCVQLPANSRRRFEQSRRRLRLGGVAALVLSICVAGAYSLSTQQPQTSSGDVFRTARPAPESPPAASSDFDPTVPTGVAEANWKSSADGLEETRDLLGRLEQETKTSSPPVPDRWEAEYREVLRLLEPLEAEYRPTSQK